MLNRLMTSPSTSFNAARFRLYARALSNLLQVPFVDAID
jgi:hypothetical protein